jgi:hypothetical protein
MQIELFGSNTETLSPIALALPSGTERHIISDGVRGTEQTISLMQKMVNSYKRNIEIRKLCGKIIANCKPKDYLDYAKKCYEWVRDNIKYAFDPHLVEFVESPKRLLETRIGDCDSQDMLLCSMFENLGFKSQFVTIQADANRPGEFTHVYTRVFIPKVGWIVADPIMPEKYFGWEPPYPNGKRYWHASSDELNQPLDTNDSVAMNQPNDNSNSGGMSGLDDIGRGGHRGGRGWRGRGGNWGYGGPVFYGDGFDDSVYILPVVVPVGGSVISADQYATVSPSDTTPQQFENPMDDGSVGVSGFFEDSYNAIKNAIITNVTPNLVPISYASAKLFSSNQNTGVTPDARAADYTTTGKTSDGKRMLANPPMTKEQLAATNTEAEKQKYRDLYDEQTQPGLTWAKKNWKVLALGFGALALFKIVTK